TTLLPEQCQNRLRFTVIGTQGVAELVFPTGWPGPARLTRQDETGAARQQTWPEWNPWYPVVEVFEAALAGRPDSSLSWQTAVRSLELDDAVRRSAQRRRVSVLEYPEATEEAGFKGTMTLVGCSLL